MLQILKCRQRSGGVHECCNMQLLSRSLCSSFDAKRRVQQHWSQAGHNAARNRRLDNTCKATEGNARRQHLRAALQVLVASDAIGMGLNLNIRRVLFHSLTRYHASTKGQEDLEPSHVKQIAGRAGRRGTEWENGLVTTYQPEDVPRLQAALDIPLQSFRAPAAGLVPEFEQVRIPVCLPVPLGKSLSTQNG